MSEEEEPAPLSEAAQEAMRRAEEKAEAKRLKHMEADQATMARAQSGASPTSSGIRVDGQGNLVGDAAPGPAAPQVLRPEAPPVMPSATQAPVPISMAPPAPELVSAAEMLAPANAQQEARAEAGRAAFALVEEQRAADVSRHAQVARDVMWYVRCGKCGGPGIWVSKRGAIGADDWWSNYKPRGVPWPSKDIWCQCCWAIANAQNPLKILHNSINGRVQSVTPYPRMLVEIDISEYARLVAAPEPEPATADG